MIIGIHISDLIFSAQNRKDLKRKKILNSVSENLTQKHSPIPSVEIRIPISANEKFLRMLRYFLESLQVFGGPIAQNAKCIVSVSRDEPYRDLIREYPWLLHYNIEFRWVDKKLFSEYRYDATGADRMMVESSADIVILADADILVANNFDPLIIKAYQLQKFYGLIAHVSPFRVKKFRKTSSWEWWERIFEKADLQFNHFKHIHTGWGFMSRDRRHRHCPFYFNYGFVISPRRYVDVMRTTFIEDLKVVDSVVETPFKSQIANTLSFERHQIPCDILPVNYNFPLHVDDEKMREFNPDPDGKNSPEDIKIFHYCGNSEINRRDFESNQTLERALMRRSLSKAGNVFQRKLQLIHEKLRGNISK